MNEQQLAAVKQALEALEMVVVDVKTTPTAYEAHRQAITALRSIISQDALYKMAEDAVTIGLSYNDWPKIGCVNHDCDKCKAVQEPVARYCCHSCFKASGGVMLDRMILCPECGNKRCPKASDHNFSCTGSNEPGQWGSIYNAPPAPQPVPVKTYHDGKPWPVAPKPWVGLTDEEIDAAWPSPKGTNSVRTLVHIIEAKLKGKNHDQ
jgi:hypothetical protein